MATLQSKVSVVKRNVLNAHAHIVMSNGVIAVPPHEFEQHSR
jgi:hypothetical protein